MWKEVEIQAYLRPPLIIGTKHSLIEDSELSLLTPGIVYFEVFIKLCVCVSRGRLYSWTRSTEEGAELCLNHLLENNFLFWGWKTTNKANRMATDNLSSSVLRMCVAVREQLTCWLSSAVSSCRRGSVWSGCTCCCRSWEQRLTAAPLCADSSGRLALS